MGPCGGCGVRIEHMRNGMGYFGVRRWFRTVFFWDGMEDLEEEWVCPWFVRDVVLVFAVVVVNP